MKKSQLFILLFAANRNAKVTVNCIGQVNTTVQKNLLSVARFFKDDDVQTRCIFWKTQGDVFPADVMHLKNCLSG